MLGASRQRAGDIKWENVALQMSEQGYSKLAKQCRERFAN